MPTTGELWPNLYQGSADRIRKQLYGSILMRDWKPDGSTSFASINPFADDGNLRTDWLLDSFPGGRWYELGAVTENGVEFNPKFSTAETKIWQNRRSQRTDVTEDDEEVMFTLAESAPTGDYLRANLPLQNVPAVGADDYKVVTPNFMDIVYRQIIVIGVDGTLSNGLCEYTIEGRPRVSLTKKGKRQWAAKDVDGNELTYGVYPDPASGAPAFLWRGGQMWLGEGGLTTFPTPQVAPVAAPVAGGKATIALAVPTSQNTPFTYTVKQTTGATTTDATIVGTPSVSSGTVTITVSGLTTGSSYTFTVTATGSNNAAATSLASNSVTAIA